MPDRPGLPLALTMGEPGGVGPELAFKAHAALRTTGPSFFVVGDARVFAAQGEKFAAISAPAQAHEIFRNALPVFDIGIAVRAIVGKADPSSAPAVIASIERAVAFALSGEAAAVVTNPIQKSSLIAAGFKYPGHTEFLEALTAAAPMPDAAHRGAVMMLAGPALKTVPVTIHDGVIAAAKLLTTEMIVRKGLILAEALRRDFGIPAPRIAVSGLNPHAGEAGAIGDEDGRIIAPAVKSLVSAGVNAVGPLPADTMFHEEARANYDAALCMLHDQALIPAKTLAFHEAVNVTLGLPIVRTSPDHGTALDIAGKGVARADSLIAALRLAASMAARRPMTDNLPPLREVIASHDLGAKKALGQHFLLDLNITRKIARIAETSGGDLILEIGPGPGGLTRALLEAGADVIAVERDARCVGALEQIAAAYPGKLTAIEGDAMRADERKIANGRAIKIVANLPYNISTELLIKWLRANHDGETPLWTMMALMFQKEVADRILAMPGSKAYGRLSVIARAASAPSRAFNLPASAFTPPPKVDSTVVLFRPAPMRIADFSALEKTTQAAFGQRRKMLRSAMKSLWGERAEENLGRAGVDPTRRAEDLTVDEFVKLAFILARPGSSASA